MTAWIYQKTEVLESTWPGPVRKHDFHVKIVDIITGRVLKTATLKYEDIDDLEQQLADFRRLFERKHPSQAARCSVVRSEG